MPNRSILTDNVEDDEIADGRSPLERHKDLIDMIARLPAQSKLIEEDDYFHEIARGDYPHLHLAVVSKESPVSLTVLKKKLGPIWESQKSLEADIKNAARNGLSVARAKPRGWYPDIVEAWGREHGRTRAIPKQPSFFPRASVERRGEEIE